MSGFPSMMVERQLSIFAAALGAALAVPQYQAMAHGAEGAPGVSLAVGVVIGAIGVLMGGAVVAGWEQRVLRLLGIVFWAAVGLAFAAAAVMGVLHSASWVGRIGFALVALLPVVGPTWVLVRLIRG